MSQVQATFAAWAREGVELPEALSAFRGYLAAL